MQENEFEKRLQEEMSEFRVRPSEVVWEKIEDELRKKKRRRVIFYLFLLAGLSLIGYSGYVLFTPEKQILSKQDIATTEKINSEKKEPSLTGDAKKMEPVDENSDQSKKTAETHSGVESKIPDIDDDNKPAQARPQSQSNRDVLKSPTKINSKGPKNKIVTKDDTAIALQTEKDFVSDAKPAPAPSPRAPEKNTEAIAQVSAEKNQTNRPVPDSSVAAIKKEEGVPAAQKQAAKKTKSSIKWALEVSGGVSHLGDKALSFAGVNQQGDAFYVNTPGNSTGGPTGGFTVYYPPSEVVRGPAFRAAVVGEMSISKRSSVSAGLGYAFYSNEIKTGGHKDSSFVLRTMTDQSVALSSYYQGPQSQAIEYRNKYHFILVPINYQLQLNKGIKVPIVWNIGVSPAYLFSTNALVYDTASGGIYYKNKEAFNKFHFNLNTGISFRVGKPNKLQWSIGPEVSMDMTGLVKESKSVANIFSSSGSGSQKRYFIYGGVTGRIYLKKKNAK